MFAEGAKFRREVRRMQNRLHLRIKKSTMAGKQTEHDRTLLLALVGDHDGFMQAETEPCLTRIGDPGVFRDLCFISLPGEMDQAVRRFLFKMSIVMVKFIWQVWQVWHAEA